jgi:hypothetical protein
MTYLASEHAPIKLEIAGDVNQLDVRGYLLTHDNIDEVARDE